MVNHSDNSKKKSLSAEALYAHYQRNRPVDTQSQKPGTDLNTATDTLYEDDTKLAETLYRHYQANRKSDTQVSIDTIMRKVSEQSVDHMVSREEQPLASSDEPQIHTIDAQPVHVDEQTKIDVPAANSANIFKRWVFPGVAAAVLGIVLIPMLMNTGSNPEGLQATLPTELSERATQTVAYIETPERATFGFADTTNAAQVAFSNGVFTTDLNLLIDADENVKTQMFLHTLVAAQASMQQGSLPDSLKKLSTNVQSNAVSMNDAIGAGESKASLHEYLATISAALQDMADTTEQLDWFVAGRSVESIRVAAEYAMENSDIKPLEQALVLANKVVQPTSEAPASGLLPELLQADLEGPEEFELASELLIKANDIILLMQ